MRKRFLKQCCYHKVRNIVDALQCQGRWKIIEILAEGEKSTQEIEDIFCKKAGHYRQKLGLRRFHGRICGSNLYYHLSELKKAGIIDVARYKEEKGGAPEKVWKLKNTKITFDLRSCDFNCKCEE